jgi:hypothetical protein
MVCMNFCISFVLLIAFFSFNLVSAPKLLHMQVHSRGVNIQIVEQSILGMEKYSGGE